MAGVGESMAAPSRLSGRGRPRSPSRRSRHWQAARVPDGVPIEPGPPFAAGVDPLPRVVDPGDTPGTQREPTMAHAAETHEDHATHAAAAAPERWVDAIVPLLFTVALTALVLWALLSARPVAAPAPVAAEPPPTAGALGAMVERSLAGGARVVVPERGVEGRLLAFIEDPAVAADKTTWFDFDRLTFETASAALRDGSREQLAAVAAILAAYPAVKLKLGGYTDNVGDPAANLKLSRERADNVLGALVQLGVAPDRLSAEGYGEQFPIGDNTTPEGRAMNRRISMRVAEK